MTSQPVAEEIEMIVKVHECKQCTKTFSRAGGLKRHIHTIHKGQKDYKCESCKDLSFSQSSSLKKHIRTFHEGQQDFKCESCGKTFSKSGHLKKHNHAIHGYCKYFKCETCGKSFSRAIYLTVVDSQCRL